MPRQVTARRESQPATTNINRVPSNDQQRACCQFEGTLTKRSSEA